MSNIDLNLYKVFLKAYECKNTTKAANELYITQPTVSYNIKELENQLNVRLFHRNSKGIIPTEQAKVLYPYIKNAIETINGGETKMKDLKNIKIGVIRIGVQTNVGIATACEYIQKFHNEFPLIRFEIVSKLLDDMIIMLEKRELDFIIDFLPVASKTINIKKHFLTTLTTCFGINRTQYPDVNIEHFNIKNLKKYPLIFPRKQSEMREELNKFLFENNIDCNPSIEVSTQLITQRLVELGLGIGFFIKESIEDFVDNSKISIINTNTKLPKMKVNIAYVSNYLNYIDTLFLDHISKNNIQKS